jgi:hypothetical protein
LNAGVIGYKSSLVAWCGASIDTRSSTVYSLCPGGHSTYRGNFAIKVKLSVDSPVMEEAARTSPASVICTFTGKTGGTVQCRVNHDGRPPSAHTYYSNQFIERLDRAMLFGSAALHPTGGYRQIVSLNPATGDYEPDGTYPDMPIHHNTDNPICKDPVTEKVYKFRLNAHEFAIFDPDKLSWSGRLTAPFRPSAHPMCVDTRRNRLFHLGAQNRPGKPPFTMDLASQNFTARVLKGSWQVFTGAGWGMVFVEHPTDPNQDAFLLRNDFGDGLVYRIHPETFEVDTLRTTGGDAILRASAHPTRTYNKWLYAPQYGVCVFMSGAFTHNVWVLRVL